MKQKHVALVTAAGPELLDISEMFSDDSGPLSSQEILSKKTPEAVRAARNMDIDSIMYKVEKYKQH